MSFFSFFTKENEPQTSKKRLLELEERVSKLESDILSVTLDQKTLRDKVLRKIQNKISKTEEEEKPKDLYNGMLLAEL